jgi:quercetin dioxygenase-like cupin family protein/quinol monooxygenase YgiN
MYGTLSKIVAKPGKKREVLEFFRWDAAVAKCAEPETLRFDVWDVPREPDAMYLYEAYTDQEAFARHKANKPYNRYVTVVEPELLDETRKVKMFDFTNSVVSNVDRMWQSDADQTELEITNDAPPGISRLAVTSFPPDATVLCHFNGYAELRRLTTDRNASLAHVQFPPGIRTDWHRHDGVQLLWFVEGEGTVAVRDGRSLSCRAGDIVRVDACVSHWHGATADHSVTHIAITIGKTEWQERPY